MQQSRAESLSRQISAGDGMSPRQCRRHALCSVRLGHAVCSVRIERDERQKQPVRLRAGRSSGGTAGRPRHQPRRLLACTRKIVTGRALTRRPVPNGGSPSADKMETRPAEWRRCGAISRRPTIHQTDPAVSHASGRTRAGSRGRPHRQETDRRQKLAPGPSQIWNCGRRTAGAAGPALRPETDRETKTNQD